MGFLQSNFNQFIGLRQMIWRKKIRIGAKWAGILAIRRPQPVK